MKISVVIPAYNEEKYIKPCIESLVALDYQDYEIVICLNACTDNTEKVVSHAAVKNNFYNFKIVHENRKGISCARQTGTTAATGEIIACADADTIYPKDWLKKISKVFEDKEVTLFYGEVRMNGGPKYLKFLARYIYNFFVRFSRLFGKDNISGMNFAFRKDAFLKIGGYDPKLKSAEDVVLGIKMKKYGKIIFDPNIFIYTSPRRFEKGFWKYLVHHVKNYWNVLILKKLPIDFDDVR